MAVRASLGAARSRLARLVAIETSIVAVAGGVLGSALGIAGLAVMRRRAAGLLPRADEISFDATMVWGAAALVAIVVVLIGILPAATSLRAATDGVGGATHRIVGRRAQRRMQRGLVVAQIAFAVVMTIGAMLVTRSLVRSLEVPLGFDAEALATVHVDPNAEQYRDPERLVALYRQVAAEIAAIPGVDATTIVNHAPLTSGSMPTRVLIDDEDAADPAVARTAMFLSVGADYFATLAIPIRRGRGFDDADLAAVNGSLIINEGFARRLWPGVDPIGRRLVVFRSAMGRADFGQPIEGRVVGVVGDVQQFGRESSPPDVVYLPFTWNPWSHTQIVARVASGRPSDLVGVLEKTMHRLHPDLATRGAGGATIRTMTDVDRRSALPRRMLTSLIVGFGASTLALVFVGLYAVVAYLTAQRTREIGVRMALGATSRRVMEMVFKEAARFVLLGLAIGVAIGLAGAGVARGVVFGIGTRDPAAFLTAIVVLGVVALAACAGPARRAARTNPSVVMRNE
jgi:predicted permease